ncbi:MAG: hypothetical protein JJT78_10345 [Leptospira sp.]|nr:hypothetical protein [Leptospira sp.]
MNRVAEFENTSLKKIDLNIIFQSGCYDRIPMRIMGIGVEVNGSDKVGGVGGKVKKLTRYPAPNVPLWCWVTGCLLASKARKQQDHVFIIRKVIVFIKVT